MGPSNIILGNRSILDLTSDTATPEHVEEGYTFHAANGDSLVGTMKKGGDEDENYFIFPGSGDVKFYTKDYRNILFFGNSNAINVINQYKLNFGPNCTSFRYYGYSQIYNWLAGRTTFPSFYESLGYDNITDLSYGFYNTNFNNYGNLLKIVLPNNVENLAYFLNSSRYVSTNKNMISVECHSKNIKDVSYCDIMPGFLDISNAENITGFYAGSRMGYFNGTLPNNVKNICRLCSGGGVPLYLYGEIEIPESVIDMSYAFSGCNLYNYNYTINIPNNVENIHGLFAACPMDENTNKMYIHIPNSVIDCGRLVSSTNYNNEILIGENVTNCLGMFMSCRYFDQQINIPNGVIDCASMFYNCRVFNQSINIPNSVIDCTSMFAVCSYFNQSINIPNSVINCYGMFGSSQNLNQPIEISNGVIDCSHMFFNCNNFNQSVSIPNSVINCSFMFAHNTISMNSVNIFIGSSVENCVGMFFRLNSYHYSKNILINVHFNKSEFINMDFRDFICHNNTVGNYYTVDYNITTDNPINRYINCIFGHNYYSSGEYSLVYNIDWYSQLVNFYEFYVNNNNGVLDPFITNNLYFKDCVFDFNASSSYLLNKYIPLFKNYSNIKFLNNIYLENVKLKSNLTNSNICLIENYSTLVEDFNNNTFHIFIKGKEAFTDTIYATIGNKLRYYYGTVDNHFKIDCDCDCSGLVIGATELLSECAIYNTQKFVKSYFKFPVLWNVNNQSPGIRTYMNLNLNITNCIIDYNFYSSQIGTPHPRSIFNVFVFAQSALYSNVIIRMNFDNIKIIHNTTYKNNIYNFIKELPVWFSSNLQSGSSSYTVSNYDWNTIVENELYHLNNSQYKVDCYFVNENYSWPN